MAEGRVRKQEEVGPAWSKQVMRSGI